MLDDHEPTWIVVADPDVDAGRREVEAALDVLEALGLVRSRLAASGQLGRDAEPERWWAITPDGWDLLGFIRSAAYG
jgi:hypothetical protein